MERRGEERRGWRGEDEREEPGLRSDVIDLGLVRERHAPACGAPAVRLGRTPRVGFPLAVDTEFLALPGALARLMARETAGYSLDTIHSEDVGDAVGVTAAIAGPSRGE